MKTSGLDAFVDGGVREIVSYGVEVNGWSKPTPIAAPKFIKAR